MKEYNITQVPSKDGQISVNVRLKKWYISWLYVRAFVMALIDTARR